MRRATCQGYCWGLAAMVGFVVVVVVVSVSTSAIVESFLFMLCSGAASWLLWVGLGSSSGAA